MSHGSHVWVIEGKMSTQILSLNNLSRATGDEVNPLIKQTWVVEVNLVNWQMTRWDVNEVNWVKCKTSGAWQTSEQLTWFATLKIVKIERIKRLPSKCSTFFLKLNSIQMTLCWHCAEIYKDG